MLLPDSEHEQRLDEVLAGYLQAVRVGNAPARSDLFSLYPDLANDLADFFADQDQVHSWTAPLREWVGPVLSSGPLPEVAGYEVLEEVARGGMGVVYRARHRSLARIVALKTLLPGRFSSATDRMRFHTEAEAVASLDHPHIVPLYEVGNTTAGHGSIPYLSMRFLEGGSLAQALQRGEWRVREPNDLRRVARLLITLADAVDYAHQRGVLHRDLKPANILLDDQGQPHVSDFGLAKRARPDPASVPGSPLTQTGLILGTPAYMPPELGRGETRQVTTAVDVYGLGAILYELLTGQPPFSGLDPVSTLRRVLEEEPLPPRALQPVVDRDLETITLKCLEKEPTRRYRSARELSMDLERYLSGVPLQARPVGPVERWLRWCRRQPVVASLSAGLILSLLAGILLVSWQWWRAERHARYANEQREQAEQARDRAESTSRELARKKQEAERNLAQAEASFRLAHAAVNDFCLYSDQELQHVPGQHDLRRKLLRAALNYYQNFLRLRGQDRALRRELAAVHASMARLHRTFGSKTAALASQERALAIYGELLEQCSEGDASVPPYPPASDARVRDGNESDRLELRYRYAATLNDVATLQPSARASLEKLKLARECYERFLAEGAPAARRGPRDLRLRAGLATTLGNLGSVCCGMGRLNEGQRWFEQAREQLEQLIEEHPQDSSLRARLADTLANLAVVLDRKGTAQASNLSLNLRRQVRDVRTELARQAPEDPWRQLALAAAHHNLGLALREAGDEKQSLEAFQQAYAIHADLVAKHPAHHRFRSALASSLTNLGIHHSRHQRKQQALKCYQQARDLQQDLVRLDPGEPGYRKELALSFFNIGAVHGALKQRGEERKAFEQARSLQEALVRTDPDHLDVRIDLGRTLQNLAFNLWVTNHNEAAREILHQAIASLRPALAKAPNVSSCRALLSVHLATLTEIDRGLGHHQEALRALGERLDLWPGHPEQLYRVSRDLARLGETLEQLAMPSAEQCALRDRCFDQAMQVLGQAVAAGFQDVARALQEKSFQSLRKRPDFAHFTEQMGTPTVR
jgi:serine/threonine protein kinase